MKESIGKIKSNLIKITPNWLYQFYKNEPTAYKIGVPICIILGFFGGVLSLYEEGWTCGGFFEVLFSPVVVISYVYCTRFFGRRYGKWFWPKDVRERIYSYKQNPFNNGQFFYSDQYWTPAELARRRWRDVALGGLFLTCIVLGITVFPIMLLIDQIALPLNVIFSNK